jgi:hypothetical protein
LTHVAQRARFGASLPSESTPAGRLLEAEALTAEMTLHTGASSKPSPSSPLGGTGGLSTAGTWSDRMTSETAQPLPLAVQTATAPDTESLAATILERMSALSTPANLAGTTEEFTSPQWTPSQSSAPSFAGPIQRAEEVTTTVVQAAAQSATSDQAHRQSPGRPSDEELTNLSRWLYPLIRFRLKGDLREDRERAGLLTDHYRRW